MNERDKWKNRAKELAINNLSDNSTQEEIEA